MKLTITPTPGMQRMIEQLAEQHGLDLGYEEAYLRLDMPGYDRLSIERIGPNQLSVAHYFEQGGDLIYDPEIVFFTGGANWTPIAVGLALSGWHERAWLTDDCTAIERLSPAAHRDLAVFAEQWALNIKNQRWREHATLTKIKTRPAEPVATQ